jgi:hypothetical protein
VRGEAVVELVVPHGVSTIVEMVERVVHVGGGRPEEVLFERS